MAEDTTTRRKRSLGQAATGGAMVGAGMGIKTLADRRIKATGYPRAPRAVAREVKQGAKAGYAYAAKKPKPKPLNRGWKTHIHAPDIAARGAGRGLQAVGLPLAAYGVVNAVRRRPTEVQAQTNTELAHHVLRSAAYVPTVEAGRKQMSKAVTPPPRDYARFLERRTKTLDKLLPKTRLPKPRKPKEPPSTIDLRKALTASEQRRLDAHRRLGRTTSLVGGTLGLSALALRAPSGAKALARRVPSATLGRLARHEEAAVRHSNTLGVGAIGGGAIGSFNYAGQQKLERKAAAPVHKGAGKLLTGGTKAMLSPAQFAGLQQVRRSVRKPITRTGQKLQEHFDTKALELANQVMPEGARRGISGSRENALLLSHKGKSPRFGIRDVATTLEAPDARGAWREAGYVTTRRFPTGHVAVTGMQVNRGMRGRGIGGDVLEQAKGNIKEAKSPGMIWRSAGYKGEGAGPEGFTTWQRPGVRYLRGVGYGRSMRGTGRAADAEGNLLPKSTRREMQRHALAARAGVRRPESARNLSPEAQANMSDASWWAKMPGGQPFLGKTRRTAGAAGLAAGGAYGANRYQERQHPRGPGGHWMSKRDDKFVRGYRERISPDAERGYRTLKRGRNEQLTQAAGAGTMTALGGWLTHHELKHKSGKAPAAIAAAGTLGTALSTAGSLQAARRYQSKIDPIKAKARSRRAQGLYGPGRGRSPVDTSSARAKAYNLAKAMGVPA